METSGPVNPDAGIALIVNYLPPSFTDRDLHQLFSDVGPLFSAKVMRNKHTQSSSGYGFVNFVKKEDAERAIDEKDGEKVLHKRIRVAYSRRSEGPINIKNANLFIGNLPLSWKEGDLKRAFSPCGKVIKSKVLIDQLTGISKGCGFVLFSKNAEAEKALKEIDGQKLPGCDDPLLVKRNNTQEEPKPKAFPPQAALGTSKEVHIIHHYSQYPMAAPTLNSIFPTAQLRPQPPPPRYTPFYRAGAPGGDPPIYTYYEYQPANVGAPFGPIPPMPSAFPSNPQIPSLVTERVGSCQANPPQRPSSGPFPPTSSVQGVSLFVRNLGPSCTELDLYQLFGPHGAISKAHIQRDVTGKAKGFGFVTFKERGDAERAIESLHGHPWERNELRPLQVSVKIEK